LVISASLVSSPEAHAAIKTIGECDLLFDYPHGSVHAGGSVSADMRIKCRTPQRYLGVDAILYRTYPGSDYSWRIPAKNKGENVNYMSAVAAESCQKATYRSEANYLIIDNNGVRHEEFGYKSKSIFNPCDLP